MTQEQLREQFSWPQNFSLVDECRYPEPDKNNQLWGTKALLTSPTKLKRFTEKIKNICFKHDKCCLVEKVKVVPHASPETYI